MEQQKFDRINELARKSKLTTLTTEELDEQKRLRSEYIAAYRQSLRNSLESITLVDEYGTKTPVRSRKEKANEQI